MISKYVTAVFPEVKRELARWSAAAAAIPDPVLREQALASIRHKTFHALGGSIYALYPGTDPERTVQFIVALQTISDYLDNLCDRTGITDETAFRRLHQAMRDATEPERDAARAPQDYYRDYPNWDDAGYLQSLIRECRRQAARLPAYRRVQGHITKYCRLYADLQSLKHLENSIRQEKLKKWAVDHLAAYPELTWFEFAAATGSTLGMFLMFAAAADPRLTESEAGRLDAVYFPWIHAWHILLDYFIDSEEDRLMGDLNFVHYYESPEICRERLTLMMTRSLDLAAGLPRAGFHRLAVHGLAAMYLSDPKAFLPQNRSISARILSRGGRLPSFYHQSCLVLRRLKWLH